MEVDLKTFVQALREGDTKKARNLLERTIRVDPGDGFGRGYLLALRGMVAALESGRKLSLVNRVVGGRYGQEQIVVIIESARERLSQKFRPDDERGFDTALVEVLREFSGRSEVVKFGIFPQQLNSSTFSEQNPQEAYKGI